MILRVILYHLTKQERILPLVIYKCSSLFSNVYK